MVFAESQVVVSPNNGTPIYYGPYYGDPQKGTPNFGKPPGRTSGTGRQAVRERERE